MYIKAHTAFGLCECRSVDIDKQASLFTFLMGEARTAAAGVIQRVLADLDATRWHRSMLQK